jgi:hypothetical protein
MRQETKHSGLNDSKHSSNLIYSWFPSLNCDVEIIKHNISERIKDLIVRCFQCNGGRSVWLVSVQMNSAEIPVN